MANVFSSIVTGLLQQIPIVGGVISNLVGGVINNPTVLGGIFSSQPKPLVGRKPLVLTQRKPLKLKINPAMVQRTGLTTGQKVAIGVGAAAAAGGIGYGVVQLINKFTGKPVPQNIGGSQVAPVSPWVVMPGVYTPPSPTGDLPGGGEVGIQPIPGAVVQDVAAQILAAQSLTPQYGSISELPGYSPLGNAGLMPPGSDVQYQGMLNGIPLVGASTNPYDYLG